MDDLYPHSVMKFTLLGGRTLEIRSNKEYDCGLDDEAIFYIYVEDVKLPYLISDIKIAMGAAIVAQWTFNLVWMKDKASCPANE